MYQIVNTPITQQSPQLYVAVGSVIPPSQCSGVVVSPPIYVEIMAGEDTDVNTHETADLRQVSIWDAEGIPLTPSKFLSGGTWWIKIGAQESSQTVTIYYTV
jgi:hypothetical protein